MSLTLSLDWARSLFAAVWAGIVAVLLALLWIALQAASGLSTSLAADIIGAGSFALLMALFAGLAVWVALHSIGAQGKRYGVALLLADVLFAVGVSVAFLATIAMGSYLDKPDASWFLGSFLGFAVIAPLFFISAFVVAFGIAVPASLLGAALFELLREALKEIVG